MFGDQQSEKSNLIGARTSLDIYCNGIFVALSSRCTLEKKIVVLGLGLKILHIGLLG